MASFIQGNVETNIILGIQETGSGVVYGPRGLEGEQGPTGPTGSFDSSIPISGVSIVTSGAQSPTVTFTNGNSTQSIIRLNEKVVGSPQIQAMIGSTVMMNLSKTNNTVTFLPSTGTNPTLQVSGTLGVGQVYDTLYNVPPVNTGPVGPQGPAGVAGAVGPVGPQGPSMEWGMNSFNVTAYGYGGATSISASYLGYVTTLTNTSGLTAKVYLPAGVAAGKWLALSLVGSTGNVDIWSNFNIGVNKIGTYVTTLTTGNLNRMYWFYCQGSDNWSWFY